MGLVKEAMGQGSIRDSKAVAVAAVVEPRNLQEGKRQM